MNEMSQSHTKHPKRTIQDTQAINALLAAAQQIKSEAPALTLIEQLFTTAEKVTLGRRILVAQMILDGKSRLEICGELGVSPNQVARVRKWLAHTLPTYSDVINTPQPKKSRSQKEFSSYDPTTLAGMRHKYPAHFLLFNLAETMFTKSKTNQYKSH